MPQAVSIPNIVIQRMGPVSGRSDQVSLCRSSSPHLPYEIPVSHAYGSVGSNTSIAPTVIGRISIPTLEARVDHIWPCLHVRDAARSVQVCIRWPNPIDSKFWLSNMLSAL